MNDLSKKPNVDEILANVPKEHRDRGLAAGAGATAGGVVGSILGGPVGAAVGASLGGAVGVLVREKVARK